MSQYSSNIAVSLIYYYTTGKVDMSMHAFKKNTNAQQFDLSCPSGMIATSTPRTREIPKS
jgi:hypothetical protein